MGFGEAKYWMQKAEKAFERKIGVKLFYGTLNVELKEKYILNKNIQILNKEEYGGSQEVYIKPCEIFKRKAYIIRTQKNSSSKGDHPLNLLEIVSDINFRKKYNLKDGDEIKIEIK
ncbi:MAG: DUF120 domain-containing protein [Clostridia bacterium]|nr:DUF120 domain-containing protein [Clostridia bacterium]